MRDAFMQPEDDPDLTDELYEAARQITRLLEEKENRYDPAIGPLPEWIPAPIKSRYATVWDALLGRYPYQRIRKLIDRYKRLGNGVEWEWIGAEPRKLFDDIGRLAHVEYAVALGWRAGLIELAGDHGWQGRKSVNSGKLGHEATHGTDAKKIEKWTAYLATAGEIYKRNPHLRKSRVFQLTADHHDKCKKTVQRAYWLNLKKHFTEDPFL